MKIYLSLILLGVTAGCMSPAAEPSWQPTTHRATQYLDAIRTFEASLPVPSPGGKNKWEWDQAHVFRADNGHLLIWVFYVSDVRGKIWTWYEIDEDGKVIVCGGHSEG